MAEKILMPRLSDTMTEGVIADWHKKVGDPVKKGDLLAEIETDKATMELESYKDGVILYLGAPKGSKLQVDDLLAIVGEAGEDISGLVGGNGASSKEAASKPETQKEAAAPQQEAPKAEKKPSADVSGMEEVVLMPRLSDTMTEGVIASWAKNVGDAVKKGDLLAEIETDKATMELESYKNGTLLYQGAKKGEKIQVNDLLCIIGDPSKVDVDAIVAAVKGGGAAPATADAGSEAAPAAQETTAPAAEQPAAAQSASSADGRIKASPLAKKLAAEKGIDLSQVQGSGDNGRIIKSDIDNYKPGAAAPAQPEIAAAPAGQVSFEDVPVSQMRKVIAKRLAESKFTAPHFYLTMQIDMDNAVASRARINETSPVKISFNDFVLKACAIALKKHPAINSSWLGDKIRTNHHINIGVAVAVEEGLLVPVVRFADTKSLSQIAVEVKEFAKKAKDKKLQPSDWEGNTFTISNLGMFGIDEFTAIINPPDACILAIGGIAQVPVVKNGAVVPGNIMKVTLSCDHRVVDGAKGAAFLQTLKELLEEPLRMLV
ncbi:pyruvate dehydrogenase complex dihydrolipoamide acetyltransferase [Niabella ginsenosidivorans]|uniref:Acetyltransferase component of pyruvate dehydrogenase complex n=1 Tax=Niabella ginsenosidivorans TaxID=1176587 RepID=A0A1A9I0X9_9BACT|nr:pyruvate dehydrogenase complex dihydrolipoamide acetyltransferase [Niabella ginsenosidivorans]ANH80371.1 pyruvate dehydrogenase complex dihydrolipoamide acetyltransferase [Niabella ginsenosidivorans]